jgi:hypothetical protein
MAASLVMGGCVYGLSGLLGPELPAFAALGLLIASGVVIYTAALWLLDPWVRTALASGKLKRKLRGGHRQ